MSRIWQALVVALAVGLGLAFWLWPGAKDASPPAKASHRAAPAVGSGPVSESSPAPRAHGAAAGMGAAMTPMRAPVRMRSDSPDGTGSGLSREFAGEDRHDEWAGQREADVADRTASVLASAQESAGAGAAAVRSGPIECRARSCKIPLSSGDPAAIARAIEWMGDERGFYRQAQDMMVEAVESTGDGPRSIIVYLRFAR